MPGASGVVRMRRGAQNEGNPFTRQYVRRMEATWRWVDDNYQAEQMWGAGRCERGRYMMCQLHAVVEPVVMRVDQGAARARAHCARQRAGTARTLGKHDARVRLHGVRSTHAAGTACARP